MRQEALYLNYAGFQCLEGLEHSNLDLYLTTCGIQNCFSGHFFGPGERDCYILHFIGDGKGVFSTGGKEYVLERGDVFLISPKQQVYYRADEKNPWSYMWVGFQGIKAASYLELAGFSDGVVTGRCTDTPLIFSYVQQMIINRHLTQANELKREAALLQIFAMLIEQHKETLPKEAQYDYPYEIYARQAVDYIQKHCRENIKVQDIAAYIGIDRSYLANVFKQMTGASPQEYLQSYRMEQAKEMLKNSERKISEIAYEIGYSDPLSFSKMFKKYEKMSPMEYRSTHSD